MTEGERTDAPPASDPPAGAVLIPARDEEETLPAALEEVRAARLSGACLETVLVVDNGSSDDTVAVAREGGARVVAEPRAGYGRACRRGLRELAAGGAPPDVVVVLDADDAPAAAQLDRIVAPVVRDEAELATGRRLGPEGVPLHASLGNAAVATLLRGLYGTAVRDMGPFRALRWEALSELELDDPAYGWNVQMTVRALRRGHRVREVPVAHRPRKAGRSKISGTVRGSVAAARGMLAALAREILAPL